MLASAPQPRLWSLDNGYLAAAAYCVTTLLMTFPLVLSWHTALPAGYGDIWQNYWNLWWWKQCLLEGVSPFQTQYLFFPHGTDLVFHTHSPFNQVLSMPVNLLFGEAAAYNFCVMFALTVSGFAAYLLVRDLTSDPGAAFLAGLVFAYFPNLIEQTQEHLNLFAVQFIPLALLYLLRWERSARTADALAFGACFGLNALCSWHLGLKLAMIVVPVVAWIGWRNRQRWHCYARGLGLAAALAVLIVLPAVSPMVASIAAGADFFTKQQVPRGIDASYLLTPSYANPLLGSFVESRYAVRAYRAAGFVCYLGLVPILLAALGAWRAPRRALGWLALLALGVMLAVGVDPWWNGNRIEAGFLPFGLLREIPLLENLRVANRFMLVAGLGLAVLAGIGWHHLRHKRPWALPVAAALVLAEYSWLPFPIRSVELSPLLQQVAGRPGAVLDIPFHERSRTVHNMAAQTVHGRPIAGGYLSVYPPATLAAVESAPALRELAGNLSADAVIDVGQLKELGFRTIIIHKYRLQSFQQRLRETADPNDATEWKRVLRLGGFPDATARALRQQLDDALGGAALEDGNLAIYFL